MINIRPVLLWMPIQEIVKSICNLFADKIDEDEVEKERNEEAIEEKSKIELQNEQTEEYDSKKENACDEEKNDADIMESEEKIQELTEMLHSTWKPALFSLESICVCVCSVMSSPLQSHGL